MEDDITANTLIVKSVYEYAVTTTGAAATAASYHTMTYDSTDQFELDSADGEVATSVVGATEAQYEAANALLTGAAGATPVTVTVRTGALTSGVSYLKTGS